MSFIGLLKAAAASSKTAKLIKGARGVFTIIEIADTALDAAQLGDEIARAIMGDNYSPALRDLAAEVAALGIVFDEKMTAIAQANVDISNLRAGIDSLAAIHLDYGDRTAVVLDQLKKLDQLKTRLSEVSPTTYSWFSSLQSEAANQVPHAGQLASLKDILGPNAALIVGNSLTLGLRAAYVGYAQYQKKKLAGKADTRPRSNAFSGGDAAATRQGQVVRAATYRTARSRAATVGKYTLKGVNRLVTVGSFGMNIYFLISKVNQFQAAMRELRTLRDRYEREIPIYEQALSGVPRGNEAALQTFADFFDLDISQESTKESLYAGYNGTVQDYETIVVNLLGAQDDSATPNIEESDGIEGAYQAMIAKFEETYLLDSDQSTIQSLKGSYQRYRALRATALDAEQPTEVRKEEGLDPIREEFSNSVSAELNKILSTLASQIDDHNSLNTLLVLACELIVPAEEVAAVEADIEKTKAQLQQTQDDFIREILEEKLALLTDKLENLQPDIASKAQLALDLIKGNIERTKFRTLEEVIAALELIVNGLPATGEPTPIPAIPFEKLTWQIDGPGTTAIKPDDSSSTISYDYSLSGRSVWTRQTWTYYAEAPASGSVAFDWNYSGFHAWYRPFLQVSAFVDTEEGRKYNTLLEGNKREGEGSSTFETNKGEMFGFIIKGSNFDRDSRLLGTLKVDFKN